MAADSGGGGKQSQAQSFGFPASGGVLGQCQHLHPGGEFTGQGHSGAQMRF